jgi:hypothetical protein
VRRRGFSFALFAATACLWPFDFPRAADAQQTAWPRRIGVLLVSRSPGDKELQAFRRAHGCRIL